MKRINKDMEKIYRYFDNQVDEKEKEEVTQRLAEDAEFRKCFDEMEALLEGIRHSASKTTAEEKLQNLEATMHRLEEEDKKVVEAAEVHEEDVVGEVEGVAVGAGTRQENVPVIIVWYNQPVWRAIAASFLLLVAAVYVFGPFRTMSDEKLFDKHFSSYLNTQGAKRGEVTEMGQRERAYAFYDMKDYEAAIPLFVEIAKDSENQIADKFYLANAYLASGKGRDAANLFNEIVDKRVGLASPAKWYLALSYLKTGERDKARKELHEIVEVESDYAEDAKKILGKMKK